MILSLFHGVLGNANYGNGISIDSCSYLLTGGICIVEWASPSQICSIFGPLNGHNRQCSGNKYLTLWIHFRQDKVSISISEKLSSTPPETAQGGL